MVTCLVCGKKYDGGDCPRCKFPDVQIPGMGREKAIIHLKPAIEASKTAFLENIRVEVISYRWKDQDGTIVLDRQEALALGTGTALTKGEVWLPGKFARIADETSVPVKLRITAGDEVTEKTVRIPNLNKPELQQLGAKMDQNFNITLLLRNDSQKPAQSDPTPLF